MASVFYMCFNTRERTPPTEIQQKGAKQRKRVSSLLPRPFGSGCFLETAGQPEGRPKSVVRSAVKVRLSLWPHHGEEHTISSVIQVVIIH